MDKSTLRIVFMGTPEFAVESLQTLVEGGYNVVAVVTQPDKPVGRHQDTLQASPVKRYALEHNIPVLQPVKMKDESFIEQLRSFNADIQSVVAFRMLPEVVWGMPRFGTFNVHAALLPQYRGAAPINWAVINGETQTGVTTFFLDKDIDTGRIIDKKTFDIPDDADVEYVYDGLMRLGAQLCKETIDKVIECDGDVPSVAQEDNDCLKPAPKIFKETCEINWNQPAKQVSVSYTHLRTIIVQSKKIMKQAEDIKNAVEVLRRGGVILYPTDTVWGIGCDATNAEAVAKVYKIKQRDDSKAMICLVDSDARLQRYVREVPAVAWDLFELADKPTTVILDGAVNLAPNLIAEDGSIAMRITREEFSKELCFRFQKALVSTSANISGQPAAANYCDISQEILDAVDYVCFSRRQEHKPHTPSSIIKLALDGEVKIIRK